ncbi:hypothetical protein [Streptomyces sp. 142MFCol3.1]|nr:hypothetical protein [Streptomyces sp. 142MFCol3.1]
MASRSDASRSGAAGLDDEIHRMRCVDAHPNNFPIETQDWRLQG